MREEGRHEAEDDEHPQGAKEVRHPVCKVVFGLAGEERKGNEDGQRDNQSFNDQARVVEAGDHRDTVRLQSSKTCEKRQVDGVAASLPVRKKPGPDRVSFTSALT